MSSPLRPPPGGDLTTAVLDNFRSPGRNSEFHLACGTYRGAKAAVCSAGIGGAPTENADETSRLGVHVFARVSGMGVVPPEVEPGSMTVVQRDSRAQRFCLRNDRPGLLVDRTVAAVIERAGHKLGDSVAHVSVMSCAAHYVSDGRLIHGREDVVTARVGEAMSRGAASTDMECERLFAIDRAGAIPVTHVKSTPDEWPYSHERPQRGTLQVAAQVPANLSLQ